MILVMCLENGLLIFYSASNSVVLAHDVSKLIEIIEDMDTNAPVKPSWFEKPQILFVVAAVTDLVRCFISFLFALLHILQSSI